MTKYFIYDFTDSSYYLRNFAQLLFYADNYFVNKKGNQLL